MEVVNWFFNSDFESRLTSGEFNQYNSNKQNQEFEYFINYLNPNDQIFTLKDYSDEFRQRFKDLTSKKFLYTSEKKNVRPWCQSFEQVELLKKFQSKEILFHFKNLGLLKHELELISSEDQVEAGYIYKEPYSCAGMGNYEFELHFEKIKKRLKNHKLIKEKKLNRFRDFSALFDNNKLLSIYENEVDKHYHYKGTLIGDFDLGEFRSAYKEALDVISNELINYAGVYSIDSFMFTNNSQSFLQPVSEINMRKTMGYFAYRFKETYYPNFSYGKLLLVRNKNFSYKKMVNCVLLSPLENNFLVFFLVGEGRAQVIDLENQILSTCF